VTSLLEGVGFQSRARAHAASESSIEFGYVGDVNLPLSSQRDLTSSVLAQNIVIGIATAGRREQLRLTLQQLSRQEVRPTRIIVCPAAPEDFDAEAARALPYEVTLVHGPRGLPAQRNAILRECTSAELVIFLDDDFYPAKDYVKQVLELFKARPDIVMATHHPALDGGPGPGVTHEAALSAIAELERRTVTAVTAPTYGGYGCNMTIRLAPIREHQIWFDERLPLYGWLEDIDFSRRVAPHGNIVSCSALRGVHLGTKRGRTSGTRLGYSQIANPVYMLKKGSMNSGYAFRQMARNLAKNLVRSLHPEPWVDRRGRLKGNALALLDLCSGQLAPERVLNLK